MKNFHLFFCLILFIFYFKNSFAANCNGIISYDVNPVPLNGGYPPGTVVTITYSMNGYTQAGSNWIEGFDINLGSGWLQGSLSPILAPNDCNGSNGNWIWANSFVSNAGNSLGPGYFFDLNLNGLSYDDFGDAGGNCLWTFSISIIVGNNLNAPLSVDITPVSDGYAGSWGSQSCDPIPSTVLSNSTIIVVPCSYTASINSQTFVHCFNDSTGSFSLNTSGTSSQYQYSIDGINFIDTAFFENLVAGNYMVTIVDSSNCIIQVPVEIEQPLFPFSANINFLGNSAICSGVPIQMFTDSSSFYSYQWQLNGINIDSANSYYYQTDSIGVYNVLVSNQYNCNAISNNVSINSFLEPEIYFSSLDTLVWENDSLQFTVYASPDSLVNYQWQVNLGSGFENIYDTITYNGFNNDTLSINNAPISLNEAQFRCIVSNGSCDTISGTINLYVGTLTNINKKMKQPKTLIAPNPASNYIFIETDLANIGKQIKVYSADGRLNIMKKLTETKNTIDIQSLSKGLYFVKMEDNNLTQKLIVQ